ncbi:class F sortase [Nocardioides aquiterrae]|uniref:Class F sortase n=1 Tax=Nocardioides aquiterrae TaxID=203799 RepID=A0ABN1UMC6_9ACTN
MPDLRAVGVAAAGLCLAAAGAFAWWAQPGGAVSADPGSEPQRSPLTGTTAKPELAHREPGAPERLRIPALDVDARVLPVHAPGRTLVPPSDPTKLGWWADGAEPGADRGSALVAGHTVHTGGGALDDLEHVDRGDAIVVRTDHGTIRYVVQSVHVYRKGRIAEDAEKLFSQDVPGRLVVLTCEDWDGERYLSNVVVTATPRG